MKRILLVMICLAALGVITNKLVIASMYFVAAVIVVVAHYTRSSSK